MKSGLAQFDWHGAQMLNWSTQWRVIPACLSWSSVARLDVESTCDPDLRRRRQLTFFPKINPQQNTQTSVEILRAFILNFGISLKYSLLHHYSIETYSISLSLSFFFVSLIYLFCLWEGACVLHISTHSSEPSILFYYSFSLIFQREHVAYILQTHSSGLFEWQLLLWDVFFYTS